MTSPPTVSAARLSGCANFASVRPGPESGTVAVPDWGLTLRTAAPWREGVSAVGIRAGRVRPAREGDVNVFRCLTVRAVEDVSSIQAELRPEGADPAAPPLWMELAKESWASLPDRTQLLAAVRPEDLMLLEGGI